MLSRGNQLPWAIQPVAPALVLIVLLVAAAPGAAPGINPGGVVNGASFSAPLSAGSIASLFGVDLAAASMTAGSAPLPTSLGGVVVRVGGREAPLFFVSPTQINFQVPWELAGQAQAAIAVTAGGATGAPVSVPLTSTAPGLFSVGASGRGQGAVLIGGFVLAAATGGMAGARAAVPGDTVSIFCTGLGAVSNPPPSGAAAGSSPLSNLLKAPGVTIGGVPAKVTFAGLAPGFAGLYQINAEVPAGLEPGDAVAVLVTAEGAGSNQVTIAVGRAGTTPTLFSSLYRPAAVAVTPTVSPYALPLDLNNVTNWTALVQPANTRYFDLGRIRSLLEQNGFGVTAFKTPTAPGGVDDIVEPYRLLKDLAIPILVTTDTVLHLYHIQFDETLREVEEREFFGSLLALTQALLADALEQQAKFPEGALAEAARRNVAYLAVALKLLDPAAAVPAAQAALVDKELALIDAHSGLAASPLFVYLEDYSQYLPRGHYTRSETLKKYFKAMMWYGRMGFLLKNSDLLPAPNAEIQTLGACLLADALDRVTSGGRKALELWNRIYAVTAFYVGLADDLTPAEYQRGIQSVAASAGGLAALADLKTYTALRAYLASLRNPQIYGGTGGCAFAPPFDPAKIDECLDKSKGLRFMGQRFIPDSYIFQNLVGFDYAGRGEPFTLVQSQGGPIRGFPRGLDAMDLLGSARAQEILVADGDTQYRLYAEQRARLAAEFAAFSEQDWNRNLYWGWLYALKALLVANEAGYPSFMQTRAWVDRNLNSALASWAELRHDTILYAKQSSTPITTSLPPETRGYVEPAPQFYGRLLALTQMTMSGLGQLNVLSDQARARLESLSQVLDQLLVLSQKELRNQALSPEEYAFIRNIGGTLETTVLGVSTAGTKTTLIADVHTDLNSAKVLEEGVGYIDILAAVIPQPDGKLSLALGPVLSYYEFKWPTADRLTDEAWSKVLAGQPPARPAWSASFLK